MQQNNLTRPVVIIYYWVPTLGVDWSLPNRLSTLSNRASFYTLVPSGDYEYPPG